MAKLNQRAIYVEMTKDTRTSQVLLTPPSYNPTTDTMDQIRVMARKVSELHPKRSWKTYRTKKIFEVPSEPTVTPTLDMVIEDSVPYLKDISDFFLGYSAGGWEMRMHPLTVEMSYDDIRDVREGKTPAALMRRITRVRAEAGFPTSIYPVKEPVAPAYEIPLDAFDAPAPLFADAPVYSAGGWVKSSEEPASPTPTPISISFKPLAEEQFRWENPFRA